MTNLFQPYDGWESDYNASRQSVGLLAISDCWESIDINGPDANALLERTGTNTVPHKKIGYTAFCDQTGQVVALAWVVVQAKESAVLYVDKGLGEPLAAHLQEVATTHQLTVSLAVACPSGLAIIGPQGLRVIQKVAGEDMIGLPYLGWVNQAIDDVGPTTILRCGLTGEYDYRVLVSPDQLPALAQKIEQVAGAMPTLSPQIMPLLQLEMKSVATHQCIPGMTAVNAGLHGVIGFNKPAFLGKQALTEQKNDDRYLRMIMLQAKQALPVLEVDTPQVMFQNQPAGTCVGGGYSPTIGRTVLLAYVHPEVAWPGLSFSIQSNGTPLELDAVSSPIFITQSVGIARQHGA